MFACRADGRRYAGAMKLAVVRRWHEALAAGAVEEVVALTEPDVAIGGPRGTARGHDVLRAWAASAGARLEPVRWFCGPDGRVVVDQRATWPDGSGRRTAPLEVATAFTVAGGRIGRIDRHPDLPTALAAAGLELADEVPGRGER